MQCINCVFNLGVRVHGALAALRMKGKEKEVWQEEAEALQQRLSNRGSLTGEKTAQSESEILRDDVE